MLGEHISERAARLACSASKYLLGEQNPEHKNLLAERARGRANLAKIEQCAHEQCEILRALIGRCNPDCFNQSVKKGGYVRRAAETAPFRGIGKVKTINDASFECCIKSSWVLS
uniref:Uncharacterized protein n=1 Tax=Romanomermis culicivorax TaxID=13658 RepID=A0A915KUF4_ROMCU